MTPGANRRRGLLLLALALASGGLAASQVHQRVSSVEARVGPLVPVLVAARDLASDTPLEPGVTATRQVPARYVPPDALGPGAAGASGRTVVAVPSGTVLTASLLGEVGGSGGGLGLQPGERALELTAAGGEALAAAAPGSHVDVLVSREAGAGGSTFMALENVELLGLRTGAGAIDPDASTDAATGDSIVTLRVSARQAVYLTAAQNFGREVRLLPRPAGDRRRSGPIEVSAGDL
ncbi:MAG TPA: Flp pilus assembly protein CpaB [Thermoleophilaceae bacterium]